MPSIPSCPERHPFERIQKKKKAFQVLKISGSADKYIEMFVRYE